jgi:hypothetical protein
VVRSGSYPANPLIRSYELGPDWVRAHRHVRGWFSLWNRPVRPGISGRPGAPGGVWVAVWGWEGPVTMVGRVRGDALGLSYVS